MQYYARLHVSQHAIRVSREYTTHLIPGYALPVQVGPFDVSVIQAQTIVVPILATVEVIAHGPV